MDTTQIQAKIDSLTTKIQQDQSVLDSDNAALASAQNELANATLVNGIEAADLASVNAALEADGSTRTIVDSAPVVTATTDGTAATAGA